MAEIRVENLKKNFGEFVAVRDSSFTVRNGEFFCLLGRPAAARPRRCA
jgi:multiple sugar transport system ATP-binding protein